jgi:hypothetical protein
MLVHNAMLVIMTVLYIACTKRQHCVRPA